jgi:ABC-2 type transport system permease protein
MRKFLAVVKHEYKKIVLKWTFLVATLVFPLIATAFAVVPALLLSMNGEATKITVADKSGKLATRIEDNLSKEKEEQKAEQDEALKNLTASQAEQAKRAAEQIKGSFEFVDYSVLEKSDEQIKQELSDMIVEKDIDAYVIVPSNYAKPNAPFEIVSRKPNDITTNSSIKQAINAAIRSQRLADANINEDNLKSLSQNLKLDIKKFSPTGDEKDNDSNVVTAFIVGLMIYITLLIYGQQILSAVVEEKETRIAEILFSSAKPFELMMGKLVGVGLAGLTQLAIWIISLLLLVGFGLANATMMGMDLPVPDISPLIVVYFFIFFLLGFFIYATIYALIGSMVTTVQEGSQFAMIPVIVLVIGFYMSFAVIRDPNSSVAMWVSIAPFFAPITMPVRILAETPPFWQIALSIILNGAAIAGLVWLAARVYRVGMLMYGKKATIPEVWKWIRQS